MCAILISKALRLACVNEGSHSLNYHSQSHTFIHIWIHMIHTNHLGISPPRPTQPPTLTRMGNEYWPKYDDALQLRSKGRMAHSILVWLPKDSRPSATNHGSWESNSRPLSRKPNVITTRLPSHRKVKGQTLSS